jgi:excisionase family DNA binding protein
VPELAVQRNRFPSETQTLSLAEAAFVLGVHRLTLRAAIERGEIRAVRVGRRWLVPRSAIADFLGGQFTDGVPGPRT